MDGRRLLVLAPDGTLTALECGRGRVFMTVLPEMPSRFEHLHVTSGPGRHLVVAGGHDPGDVERAAAVPFGPFGDEVTPPITGAIWAVDRTDGALLWPAPATIDRHAVPLHQPPDLPVIALLRRHHEREQARVEVVCLDSRTGHAIFQQDLDQSAAHGGGIWLEGDPDDGTIAVLDGGTRRADLLFTGAVIPPQSPFRTSVRGPADPPPVTGSLRVR